MVAASRSCALRGSVAVPLRLGVAGVVPKALQSSLGCMAAMWSLAVSQEAGFTRVDGESLPV